MYRRSPLRSTLRIVCSTGLPTCLPIYSTGVLFGMMPCLTDWLGSAGSFYLKPPTGNLGTRTAIRTTVRPQLAHGRDSQSRPNLSREPLGTISATGSPSKIQATGCARQRATVEPCPILCPRPIKRQNRILMRFFYSAILAQTPAC